MSDDHRTAISTSDVLLLQLELPIEIVESAARWGAECGVTVVLTPAPVRPVTADLLEAVDLLVPNEHEAELLTGAHDPRTAAETLLARGAPAVAVTMGRRGCLYADRSGVVEVPAIEVPTVDTTAAGDTFVAALTLALAEGRTLPEGSSGRPPRRRCSSSDAVRRRQCPIGTRSMRSSLPAAARCYYGSDCSSRGRAERGRSSTSPALTVVGTQLVVGRAVVT